MRFGFTTICLTVRCLMLYGIVALALLVPQHCLWGQESGSEKGPAAGSSRVELSLLEREPFDQITLDAVNDNAVLDIVHLEDPPTNPKSTDRLRVRLLNAPDEQFQVEWRHITSFRSYEKLLLNEAKRLVDAKKFNAAFPYFSYLLSHPNRTPGLSYILLEYLFDNANELASKGEFEQALVVFQELVQRDPEHRTVAVDKELTRIVDQLIGELVKRGDYARTRGLFDRISKAFGPTRVAVLKEWRTKLIDKATALKQKVEEKLAARDYREAERLCRQTVNVWPELPGIRQLSQEIAERYPIVIVGVAEAADRQDLLSIDSWSARRTGRLTQRALLEFLGAGPEGGEYRCRFGDYYQSDDRRHLSLDMDSAAIADEKLQMSGYDVARLILAAAQPKSDALLSVWGSLIQGVAVEKVFQVRIDLRRSHVLPEGMLRVPLGDLATMPNGDRSQTGAYVLAAADDSNLHFVVNSTGQTGEGKRVAEIVERHYRNSRDAVAALRRGDVDVVDCLIPDDAVRLASDDAITVGAYGLPTVHMLVPTGNNLFVANQTFRRAMVYAIDRQGILDSELLGRNQIPGCRVISGPFPAGVDDNDPLAYAYDLQIEPRAYDPRLAAVLKTLARRELVEVAAKRDEQVPKKTRLVIGFPANELARVTCHAIAQQLQVIGIEVELCERQAGASDFGENTVDLEYRQVAIWEPVTDIHRLLATTDDAAQNEYVGMALRRLEVAKNWREARERLHELHRIVYDQVAVIPLWQTVDHFAVGPRLRGVGTRPLTLYQNVQQWRVAVP